jgi:hypothetical protein
VYVVPLNHESKTADFVSCFFDVLNRDGTANDQLILIIIMIINMTAQSFGRVDAMMKLRT